MNPQSNTPATAAARRAASHQHEAWQIADDTKGGRTCKACGQTVVERLTATHRAALADLNKRRTLFAVGRGRYRDITASERRFSKATLAVLVQAGYARWAEGDYGLSTNTIEAIAPVASRG